MEDALTLRPPKDFLFFDEVFLLSTLSIGADCIDLVGVWSTLVTDEGGSRLRSITLSTNDGFLSCGDGTTNAFDGNGSGVFSMALGTCR